MKHATYITLADAAGIIRATTGATYSRQWLHRLARDGKLGAVRRRPFGRGRTQPMVRASSVGRLCA